MLLKYTCHGVALNILPSWYEYVNVVSYALLMFEIFPPINHKLNTEYSNRNDSHCVNTQSHYECVHSTTHIKVSRRDQVLEGKASLGSMQHQILRV